jgi:hypothetical protein
VVELQPTEGSLREVLTSLHSLFATTREIMRRHGPAVARPRRGADLSFGSIAIAVLNGAIRPVLSRWHVELLAHEATMPPGASPVAHEREWEHAAELRDALADLRETLVDYAQLLGQVAGVPSLVLDADRRAGSAS